MAGGITSGLVYFEMLVGFIVPPGKGAAPASGVEATQSAAAVNAAIVFVACLVFMSWWFWMLHPAIPRVEYGNLFVKNRPSSQRADCPDMRNSCPLARAAK
jgi:hypothetical protein